MNHGNKQNSKSHKADYKPAGERRREDPSKPEKSVEIIEKDKEVWEKRPSLVLNKGNLSSVLIPFALGPEANSALRKYFNYLINEQDTTRPRFIVQERCHHPHPVGAFIRAHMGDLIPYKYAPKGLILDIGTSRVRLNSRYDLDGQPLYKRVHSMAPVLSGRDILRDMSNNLRFSDSSKLVTPAQLSTSQLALPNSCNCVGGQWKSRCTMCTSEWYDTTSSVDSIYYPGVMEEIAVHGITGSVGYVVFNDYDKARIVSGSEGYALDKESHYTITGNVVTSKVEGNPAPYQHRFLNTGGNASWQFDMVLTQEDTISQTHTHHTYIHREGDAECVLPTYSVRYPHKKRGLFRPGVYQCSCCRTSTNGATKHQLRENREFTKHIGTHIRKRVTKTPVVVVFETVEEFMNGDIPYKLCRVYTISKERLRANREEHVAGIPVMKTFYYQEEETDKPTKGKSVDGPLKFTADTRAEIAAAGQLMTELVQRTERVKTDNAIWEALINQYEFHIDKRSERFFLTKEEVSGETHQYVNMEMLSTKWYSLGLATIGQPVKARLETVIEAYLQVGNKKIPSSIRQACINMQRTAKGKISTLDVADAFLIARVMRSQEDVRFTEVLGKSLSILKSNNMK